MVRPGGEGQVRLSKGKHPSPRSTGSSRRWSGEERAVSNRPGQRERRGRTTGSGAGMERGRSEGGAGVARGFPRRQRLTRAAVRTCRGCPRGCHRGCPSGCPRGCPRGCLRGYPSGCPSRCPRGCPSGCPRGCPWGRPREGAEEPQHRQRSQLPQMPRDETTERGLHL